MARRILRSPSQPRALRALLWVYEFCASLKLAVVMIFLMAAVLISGIFFEGQYGTQAAHFLVYGTPWFTALNAVLAVNIFCAAAIRFPWKRHQTGFVITHIGLLTLLFGGALSRRGKIDAQMPVLETKMEHVAYLDDQFFDLEVERSTSGGQPVTETLKAIPFVGGPWNWKDLDEKLWFPFRFPRTWRGAVDRGVLYDQDGIKLEVLDYYASAAELQAPRVELKLAMPRRTERDEDGEERLGPQIWQTVALAADANALARIDHQVGFIHRQTIGGGQVCLWMTREDDETKAFLVAKPNGSLGDRGQVALYVKGQTVRFLVDEKLDKKRFSLGTTGLEAELIRYLAPMPAIDPQAILLPAVEFKIYTAGSAASSGSLFLSADSPEFSHPDRVNNVYGAFWFDHQPKNAAERMAGKGKSRLDIIQGPDQRLYYRFWKAPQVVFSGLLPTDGTKVDALQMLDTTLPMYVTEFEPHDQVGRKLEPLPFNKGLRPVDTTRAAKVKLTVDDESTQTWVISRAPDVNRGQNWTSNQPIVVTSRKTPRTVRATLRLAEVDLGVRVELVDFERRLDAGTKQPSHYSSLVNVYDVSKNLKLNAGEPVLVTMNAPVEVIDPATGRSYRLYQESFQPGDDTWGPGHRIYQETIDPASGKTDVFRSVFTVNYEPGRGIIYAGCSLIVAGIGIMFYMKAYFFAPRKDKPRAARAQVAVAELVEETMAT